jgi:Ca2+-binding RTX toxin-like protein
MSRTRLLTALAVAIAALVLPAAANATFQARILNATQVGLTGDDTAEQVVISRDAQGRLAHNQTSPGFASPLDFDTATPGVQGVSGSKQFVVDGEGGDDRITVTATAAPLSADGGEGNDVIIGADGRDLIQGGTGADLADGGAGADRIFLGSGNDFFHWRPSNSSDRLDGGDGDDVAVVAGTSAADRVEVRGDETRYAVDFLDVAGFRLAATEQLWMNLFEGNDELITRPMPAGLRFNIDGGTGNDHLGGGPDADEIRGGGDRDQVTGAGGDDLLIGENMNGDEGNDFMAVQLPITAPVGLDGEGGYDIARVIGTSADETFTVAPLDSAFVTVAGAATDSESLIVDAQAGNDSVTVQPGAGTRSAVSVQGGTGDDVLRGADGVEWLMGSLGQDLLDGGLAPDRLLGGPDADVIRARDRAADAIECESGDDIVIADLPDLDQLLDAPACEHVDRAAATGPVALARVVATGELPLIGGTVKVPVVCSAGARGGCTGTVTLTTADAIGVQETKAPAHLGRQSFSLAPGASAEIAVAVGDGEDLARAAGSRLVPIKAQVLTALAEHTTSLALHLPK